MTNKTVLPSLSSSKVKVPSPFWSSSKKIFLKSMISLSESWEAMHVRTAFWSLEALTKFLRCWTFIWILLFFLALSVLNHGCSRTWPAVNLCSGLVKSLEIMSLASVETHSHSSPIHRCYIMNLYLRNWSFQLLQTRGFLYQCFHKKEDIHTKECKEWHQQTKYRTTGCIYPRELQERYSKAMFIKKSSNYTVPARVVISLSAWAILERPKSMTLIGESSDSVRYKKFSGLRSLLNHLQNFHNTYGRCWKNGNNRGHA